MQNQLKTVLLLTSISGLFLWIGHLAGGPQGMMMALLFSILMNAAAYWFSDKIVLSMHKAEPLGSNDPWGVTPIVQELSEKSGLPMPAVYLIPQRIPNAFATGRNEHHAAVAVTRGLVDILDRRELRGVLAHELGHIRNKDILISTLVACFASAIMTLAHMLQWFGLSGSHSRNHEGRSGVNPLAMIVTALIAPLAATLIQAAISRTREFMADESGSLLTEDPEALASALQKISDSQQQSPVHSEEEAAWSPQAAFSHLYIMNALNAGNVMSLFSTHPPVEERIKKLYNLPRPSGSGQKFHEVRPWSLF